MSVSVESGNRDQLKFVVKYLIERHFILPGSGVKYGDQWFLIGSELITVSISDTKIITHNSYLVIYGRVKKVLSN